MEELIVLFFGRLAFLNNTEPEERESDGQRSWLGKLPPIRDETQTIVQRERVLKELQETLNDPDKRATLSKQFAARSDKLFMATFQLGEIKKIINSGRNRIESYEEIFLIFDIKAEDVPAVCIEVEPAE